MSEQKKTFLELGMPASHESAEVQSCKPLCEVGHPDGRQARDRAQTVVGTKLPADVKDAWLGSLYQGTKPAVRGA